MAFCVLRSFCPFLRNKIRENLLGLLCFLRLMWVKFLILFFFSYWEIDICFFSFVVICPLFAYRKRHPWNFVLLVLFTILLSFTVGVACAFSKGTVIIDWLITHLNSALIVLVYCFNINVCDFLEWIFFLFILMLFQVKSLIGNWSLN